MVILYSILFLFIAYSILLLKYASDWQAVPLYSPPASLSPDLSLSVIIPARNEEKNIAALLQALQEQSYPSEKFEVIVIDDHSIDNTTAIVRQFPRVKLLQLKEDHLNSYKKKAIQTGIAAANGELIVTTDADCIPSPQWLATVASFKQVRNAVLVTAPVVIDCNSSVVQVFQAMDFMVLQGITGAAVHHQQLSMCNGANLCYEKKAFDEVNGFSGIDNIASGDDMLLMFKISTRYPGRAHYLKSQEAMVYTQPVTTWKDFFSQRIRWASKAAKYDDKRLLPVLLLVYLFNLSFLVLAVAGCWDRTYWLYLLAAWALKTIVELPLFISVARFFNKRWAIPYFFIFQPLHILYTILSGFFGQFGKYEWKGRKVK